MLLQQGARGRANRRGDHFGHVLGLHGVQLGAGKAGQGAEREFQVLDRIERTSLVLGKEFIVAALEGVGVDGANAHQESAPLVVGVDRQQGMVEVKQGELHHSFASACSHSRSSGSVIGRWVSREY